MPKQILSTPHGPAAMGPYSIATEANGLVFCSGMVALVPETGEAITGSVTDQTHQVMKNIGAVLGDVGLGYDDIVKTTIFLADIDDFAAVNEVYAQYVGEAKPARSTFQAGALPGGFQVEIECIAAR
ncbi:MAG: reactive intermediate/imine deaminase [Armatimonadetes bacterium]|nr:MAG: reactive intermediate/imine deaminase [Armatimonadota bacterium]